MLHIDGFSLLVGLVCGTVVHNLHPGNKRWAVRAHGRHTMFPSEAALARLDCVADDGLGDAVRAVSVTLRCHSAVYMGKLPWK